MSTIQSHEHLRALHVELAKKHGTRETAQAIDSVLSSYAAKCVGDLRPLHLDGFYDALCRRLER